MQKGSENENRVLIVLVVILIITGGINLCLTTKMYSKLSDNSSKVEKVQGATIIDGESPVMNIEQAAQYIGVTAEQLIKMIQIEKNELNQTGSFSGEMIPYFKVNDDLLFYRDQLDVWVQDGSVEKVEYNLVEEYRFD